MKTDLSLGFDSETFVASSQATIVALSKTAAKKAISGDEPSERYNMLMIMGILGDNPN